MNQAVLDVAASQVGVTEWPSGSNVVLYNEWFGAGFGAWCATFVSWCCAQAGYPLPPINGPNGFSYCPSGQRYAYRAMQRYAYATGEAVPAEYGEPGDILIYSWHPFALYGAEGAWITSGEYNGQEAGDHTGFLVSLNGDGTVNALEGNTSISGSQDNGGAVLLRRRPLSQVCCVWRPANFATGGGSPAIQEEDDMFDQATNGVHLKGVYDALPMLRDLFLALGLEGANTDDEKRDRVLRRFHELIRREKFPLRLIKHRTNGQLYVTDGFHIRLLGPEDSHFLHVLRYLGMLPPPEVEGAWPGDLADYDLNQFVMIPGSGQAGGPFPLGTLEHLVKAATDQLEGGDSEPATSPGSGAEPPAQPGQPTLAERVSGLEVAVGRFGEALERIERRLPPAA